MESGKIKRPRTKVNRACYNCRRRKIKCTGKYPCTNCEAYQCDCIYFPGYVPTRSNNTTIPDGKYASYVNVNTSDSNCNLSQERQLQQHQQKYDTSSTEKTCVNTETACGMPNLLASDLNQCNQNSLDADLASDGLESMPPIELHAGSVGLYEDDIESQKKLLNLQRCLKELRSLPKKNEHIDEIINSINGQVDNLISEWEPEYDIKKYNDVLKDSSEGIKSIETHLMKNKYSDQVALTSFAVWTDTNKAERGSVPTSSFLANQPLVDDLFGLYSPIQALSLRGIGHLFQRCITMATSKEKIVQAKSNLYLLLRFFDICGDHFNQSCVSIANPLESYLQRKNLLTSTPNTTSSVSSRTSANNKDLVRVLINKLPQPFVQNVTSISNTTLLDAMNDDFDMFSLLLKMFDDHRKGFGSLMVKITDNPAHTVMFAPRVSRTDKQDFIWYCEEEELLLALCYSYYNSTLYHFDEFSGSLEYFELLLSLLDKQLWLNEKYGFQKVLDVAASYATGMGLSRWEFYVGLDESTAERRRECWWKFYCIEKQFTFLTGFMSSIYDSKMNCLLPRVFRNAGFSDHRSFISTVHLVTEDPVFVEVSLCDLAFYGECAISQVISNFYWDTLYGERYTSIKNTAKPPYVKDHLLKELFKDMDVLNTKLQAIKVQTKRLYDIAYSKNGYVDDRIPREHKILAVKHVLLQGTLFFYVSSAVNNLISRLCAHTNRSIIRIKEMKYKEVFREEYMDMTKLLLSLNDDYSVACGFQLYGHVFLMVVSGSFPGCQFEPTLDELIMILKLVRRLRDISIYRENENNNTVKDSKACNDFRRLCCFVSILTNSLLQSFILVNDLTMDEFFKMLDSAVPDLTDLSASILNPKSEAYRYLMEPIQESGVHLNVRKMLENGQKTHNKQRLYPKTAVQSLSPSSKESPQMNSFSFPHTGMQVEEKTPVVLSPPEKNVTTTTTIPVDGFLNNEMPVITNDQVVNSSTYGFQSPVGPMENTNKFNLGTLDEFVHKGDLNDLYNTLWSDIYSDELGQSILAFNNFSPEFNSGN